MMENIREMFMLGGGGHADDQTQRGHSDGNMGATQRQQLRSKTNFDVASWEDASVPMGNNPVDPTLDARFGVMGKGALCKTTANANIFAVEGGGGHHNDDPPRVFGVGGGGMS
jgi:hypothetical protein